MTEARVPDQLIATRPRVPQVPRSPGWRQPPEVAGSARRRSQRARAPHRYDPAFRPSRRKLTPGALSRLIFGLLCLGVLVIQPQGSPPALRRSLPAAGGADVNVTIDYSRASAVSRLQVGTTFMQYTLDGQPAAVASATPLLRSVATFDNQHIMGFGADNPEPAPGHYNWSSLDRRINLIRSLGATPVITLCCAPTWMVDPNWRGGTDWSQLESAPLPQHEDDFAALAKQVALRYPDVKYFQVWNEMKGMYLDGSQSWDYLRYTRLYNKVYDAVRSVRPDAKLGGPYLSLDPAAAADPISPRDLAVLDYWLANKHGADFLAVDLSLDTDPNLSPQQELAQTVAFQRVDDDLHRLTQLPIWWSEHYFVSSDDWAFEAAGTAAMLYHELTSGASVALQWSPEAQPGAGHGGNEQNLFTTTHSAGGGRPLPNLYVYQDFHRYFTSGTALYATHVSGGGLLALASGQATLLINLEPRPLTASVNGSRLTLSAYEVRLLPRS